MKVAKRGISGAAAVFAALIAGQAVAGGYGYDKGSYGAGYGSGQDMRKGYGMPYGGPMMGYPQRPQPPARPMPPAPPTFGGGYGYPTGPAQKRGGYGKYHGYGMKPGYGMGYGQAAPAVAPAIVAAPVEATESASVNISQMRFNAPTVTIKVGGTVTWTNSEGAPHTVTATDGSFSSSQLTSGDTFSHTFDKPGTYTYFCEVHPMMKATVVVEA